METINHKYYVSLEVAELLREAGFDWSSYAHYCPTEMNGIYFNNYAIAYHGPCITAPTLDVAQRWLREVKHEFVGVHPIANKWFYSIHRPNFGHYYRDKQFDIYEKAQEAGIKKVLKLILKKENKL